MLERFRSPSPNRTGCDVMLPDSESVLEADPADATASSVVSNPGCPPVVDEGIFKALLVDPSSVPPSEPVDPTRGAVSLDGAVVEPIPVTVVGTDKVGSPPSPPVGIARQERRLDPEVRANRWILAEAHVAQVPLPQYWMESAPARARVPLLQSSIEPGQVELPLQCSIPLVASVGCGWGAC
jgi:hypothetical protein